MNPRNGNVQSSVVVVSDEVEGVKKEVMKRKNFGNAFSHLDKVIQLGVLSYTLVLGRMNHPGVIKNDGILVLAYCLTFYELISGRTDDFDIVYVVYLPYMLSMIFQKNLLLSIILSLNVLSWPNYLKLLFQVVLLSSNQEQYIVRDCVAIVISGLVTRMFAKLGKLKSLSAVDCNIFSMLLVNVIYLNGANGEIHYQVFQKTFIAFCCVTGINYYVCKMIDSKRKYLKSMICLTNNFLLFPFIVQNIFTIQGKQPLQWLIQYILQNDTRIKILLTWLLAMIILIPNVLIFKSNVSLNLSRKIWHFAIIFLVIYPFHVDSQFVKVALSGTIVIFLLVEYTRYLKLEPIGTYLDTQLRSFSDFRDSKGPIIISYIYLIIGVSIPLLFANSPAGLVSLGVGDSLASIVGGKWGRLKWPGTSKTIEGTIAFILASMTTCCFLKFQLGFYTNITAQNLLKVCAISGVLEGNSVLNDNILVPTFMLIAETLYSGQ